MTNQSQNHNRISHMEHIEAIIEYSFSDKALLEEALTHPSYARERRFTLQANAEEGSAPEEVKDYERLEFLGDAVLGLVVAEMLLELFPGEKEGALAKRYSALVSGKKIAELAKELDIGKSMFLSIGEEGLGGRNNKTNLENVLEAILGAVYVDGGLLPARHFIRKYWMPHASAMIVPPKDPKTMLQEWAQGNGLPIPKYKKLQSRGPDHAPIFTVQVQVQGFPPEQAEGMSKRTAERIAADKLYKVICRQEAESSGDEDASMRAEDESDQNDGG